MDNNSSTIVSNGNDFLVEMDHMLDELKPRPPFEPWIYRVPMEIRKVNEEAYTPQIVSIGPFHHNNKNLTSMEQLKKGYMKKLVRRNGNSSLKDCTDFVNGMEADIRECYSERIEMDSKEFRKMVLVDSCFIIQFLIYVKTKWTDFDFSLYIDDMTMNRLNVDLMLLENQVPFFVLKELCRLATSDAFSILDLALCFLKGATNIHLFEGFKNTNSSELHIDSVKHFTDIVLILHQQPSSQELLSFQEPPSSQEPLLSQESQNKNFQTLYSSTELTEAGVKFREKETNRGLLDITFNKGVLEIPRFLLTDHTKIQIRNIMALELFLDPNRRIVTDYFVLMDHLINTTMDVDLLVQNKIIINYLGDNKAVADFINKLCINLPLSKSFYFSQVCKSLNKYYEVPSHKLKATLKRNYVSTPCLAASTMAAITLLVLTFIQTVCTVMSAVNGK